jgi:hypothetical protein
MYQFPHNALRSDDLVWSNTSLPLWVRRALVRSEIEEIISRGLHQAPPAAAAESFVDEILIAKLFHQ